MCGRAFQSYNITQLLRLAGTKLIKNPDTYEPSYNIGPTNYLPVICRKEDSEEFQRVVEILKWGYESPFQIFIINARAEELQLKRTFQPLMDTRRCVIIIEGYFQWNARREPYVFRPKGIKEDKEETQVSESTDTEKLPPCFYVAALKALDDTVIILTRESIGTYHDIHPRMPVLLKEDEIDMWLNVKNKFEDVQEEILDEKSEKWGEVVFYQVAPYVGNVREKSEKVLMKAGKFEEQVDDEGILRYFPPAEKEEDEKIDENGEGGRDHKEEKEKSDSKEEDNKTGILKFFSPVGKDKVEEERERMFKEEGKEKEKHGKGEKGDLHQSDIQEFFPVVEKDANKEEDRVSGKSEGDGKNNTKEHVQKADRIEEEKDHKNAKEKKKHVKSEKENSDDKAGKKEEAKTEDTDKRADNRPIKEVDENLVIEEQKTPNDGKVRYKIVTDLPKLLEKSNEEPGNKIKVKKAIVVSIEDENESEKGKREENKSVKKRKDFEGYEENREKMYKNKQVKKNVA